MALPDPAQCWHNCILSVGIQVQKDTCPNFNAKIIMLNPVIVFYNYNGTSKASFICTIKHNQGKNKHHWDVHKLCIDTFTINKQIYHSQHWTLALCGNRIQKIIVLNWRVKYGKELSNAIL